MMKPTFKDKEHRLKGSTGINRHNKINETLIKLNTQ